MTDNQRTQLSFIMARLETLQDLVKIETVDGKISKQTAREILRILDEENERLLNL